MTLQTQHQRASVAHSSYTSLSVEEQGEALSDAAYKGTLKHFTPADWAVFIGQGDCGKSALGYKDNSQMLFLHWAAANGHLDQIPHQIWEALITQDLLKERDKHQRLFLHRAAWKRYLDQIPPYVFEAMTPERGYDTEFWFGKDKYGNNILDCAACSNSGKHFPKALIPALWRERQGVLRTLWDQMDHRYKNYDGVRKDYEEFLLHPMLRPPKKGLVLR